MSSDIFKSADYAADKSVKNAVNVILNITDRIMKDMCVDHARKSGASEKMLTELADMNPRAVYCSVVVCFGEPEAMRNWGKNETF